MSRTQLWLQAFLVFAFLILIHLADGAPVKLMSAPNLLRVGTSENIFVECQDCSGDNITVFITVKNYPTKSKTLATTSVFLNTTNNFQQFGKITIPTVYFSMNPNMKQNVYLQAEFPDQLLEKVVLVTFQSGHIFIQTDKNLYTPNSRVLYRMFAVTPHMEPIDASIAIEIVTPQGIVLPQNTVSLLSGIHSGDYQLGEIVSPGLWKVVTKFHSNPRQSYSAEFEVKEYVLPSFEVKLTPESSFFCVDSLDLIVGIKARYLFGKAVGGTAYVVFGVIHEGQKKNFPSSLQRVKIENGNGAVTLRKHHITQTFPDTNSLVGSSMYVAVSVFTETDGEMVAAELRGIQIVTSPYTIYFKRTPKYFKPGMSFDVVVEVVNPDNTPAQHVPVIVDPGAVKANTGPSGMARLTINTVTEDSMLSITARTNDHHILRQANATMVAYPYTANNSNDIHIGVHTTEVQVEDNLKVNLVLRRLTQDNDITYLIMSRGQLIKYGRYKVRSELLISLIVPITKDMLPSFRFVAYYHPSDNEAVSDSVWIKVKDSCMGSLKLESLEPAPFYKVSKRNLFGLKVTGDTKATVGLVAVDKVSQFKDKLQRECCVDGMRDIPVSLTCERRSEYITDGAVCIEAFLHCCKEMKTQLDERKKESLQLARSEEDDSYMESDEIVSRTNFPESWLWTDIQLPPCTEHAPDCKSTSLVKNVALPDSITTWQITGISLSRTQGVCVSEPLEVIVRKDFFIDLKLPYVAVRGEQLEVKAILHNYSPESITVRVDLIEEKNVCSAASKRRRYRQEVNIGPETTRSVSYVIIPMREGKYNIEVKAVVKDLFVSDGIRKVLHVLPEGVLVKSLHAIILNPTEKGAGGKQEEIINGHIPRKDLVPNAPTVTFISVTGREHVAPLLENVISGESMDRLIYQPVGYGEQNMIHMTLPVIATTYLDKTNQWETVGFQKRNEALQHIKTGYETELTFCKTDGSFAAWATRPSSTWLTACVAKVFVMARDLVAVDQKVICNAVKFLILNAQESEGLFKEVGSVYHGEMISDVQGTDSDASMTAFCLIALQESRAVCAATITSLQGSIDKAVAYLEKRLFNLTNPYAIAMTSYALANEDKMNREILYKFASPESSHWPVPKGEKYTLEATAYALLALVKVKAFEDAKPVMRWFRQQQKVGGGYGSTQATIMVYQAVAEYWASAPEPVYELNVDILLPGRSKPDKYNFNRGNHYTTRTSRMKDINQDVKVIATGTGEATLTMVSLYYALPREKENDCQKFNMLVEFVPVEMDAEKKIYRLTIEVYHKNRQRDAAMSVLDIGLLTGFTVDTRDLDLLSKGHAPIIAKYEVNKVLSERRSLIIYLDKVSHRRPEVISFKMHQELNVGILQPAAVSVYEYYDQTPCVKFYHPKRIDGKLLRLCRNYECVCAEENCSMQKKEKISNDLRTAKACESTSTSRIDFVYKVKVEAFTDALSTDIYTVQILEVIKEGTSDVGPQGKMRAFLSYQHCRETLDLSKGKTYLIMGSSKDIYSDEQNQSYQYVLSETTWIEYWPTEAECRSDEYRHTCLGIEEMAQQYLNSGCQQ